MSNEIYRVVLLGKQAVGKTCLIAQYINGIFNPETISSLAAQFIRKTLEFADGRTITLDIWDTAGQEKYRAIAKIYYKEAKAVILVYDITDESSFKEMKEYWYEQIKLYAQKDIVIAIVANKNDLYEECQVSDDQGRQFANEIGAIFASTSAKNANGINALFDNIGIRILDHTKGFMESSIKFDSYERGFSERGITKSIGFSERGISKSIGFPERGVSKSIRLSTKKEEKKYCGGCC